MCEPLQDASASKRVHTWAAMLGSSRGGMELCVSVRLHLFISMDSREGFTVAVIKAKKAGRLEHPCDE